MVYQESSQNRNIPSLQLAASVVAIGLCKVFAKALARRQVSLANGRHPLRIIYAHGSADRPLKVTDANANSRITHVGEPRNKNRAKKVAKKHV